MQHRCCNKHPSLMLESEGGDTASRPGSIVDVASGRHRCWKHRAVMLEADPTTLQVADVLLTRRHAELQTRLRLLQVGSVMLRGPSGERYRCKSAHG